MSEFHCSICNSKLKRANINYVIFPQILTHYTFCVKHNVQEINEFHKKLLNRELYLDGEIVEPVYGFNYWNNKWAHWSQMISMIGSLDLHVER